jgi:8-oxo-dGTP diphosphatase
VNYGETLEATAVREGVEETSLDIELVRQFHTHSAPARDPRGHTISPVFGARSRGAPRACTDARGLSAFRRETVPAALAFDHAPILADYYRRRCGGRGKLRARGGARATGEAARW